jgi:deoxyhypusine synthase
MEAAKRNLPMFVPGWEDSTLGNMYAGHVISGDVKNVHTVRTGIEYMIALADWYTKNSKPLPGAAKGSGRHADSPDGSIGFFQIGGGIPDAPPGSPAPRGASLGLLLPDQRLDHQLRKLLRRRAQ